MFRHRHCALAVLCLSALSCLGSGAAQAPTTETSSAKIWVGRYAEIEEYLRTAECLSLEKLPALTMRCGLRPGGPVARMGWMVLPPGVYRGFFTSYKTQIAAYEFDRLLKLDMVPPTVERQVQGSTGAATLWVENVVDMRKGDAPPSEAYRAAWDKQMARVTMFDALIGNPNRNPGNLLRDQGWNAILIDHTRAFGLATDISPPLTRIERDFWDRVLALTRKDLDAKLRPWLDEPQITAMLERRDKMKTEIEKIIAEKGASAVVLR